MIYTNQRRSRPILTTYQAYWTACMTSGGMNTCPRICHSLWSSHSKCFTLSITTQKYDWEPSCENKQKYLRKESQACMPPRTEVRTNWILDRCFCLERVWLCLCGNVYICVWMRWTFLYEWSMWVLCGLLEAFGCSGRYFCKGCQFVLHIRNVFVWTPNDVHASRMKQKNLLICQLKTVNLLCAMKQEEEFIWPTKLGHKLLSSAIVPNRCSLSALTYSLNMLNFCLRNHLYLYFHYFEEQLTVAQGASQQLPFQYWTNSQDLGSHLCLHLCVIPDPKETLQMAVSSLPGSTTVCFILFFKALDVSKITANITKRKNRHCLNQL